MTKANGPERGVRLQKLLAEAGVASRRGAEELIIAGRVQVDGVTITQLGTTALPSARITVDGRPVRAEQLAHILLYKPVGYVSTVHDPEGRPTVLDLVESNVRLYPVGRLDFDSEGLIILTNDGELTNALTHPSHEVEREYNVLVANPVTEAALNRLRRGVPLDGSLTAPAEVEVIRLNGDLKWLKFVIQEGRNRQIRRMCEEVGIEVLRLVRVRVGNLRLGRIAPGAWRPLTREEIAGLKRDSAGPARSTRG